MNGTLNKVILIGNVGKELDMYYFDDRSVVARFPLATSETYRDPSGQRMVRTQWHRIVARNQIAEIFKRYLKKGDKIYIEGKLRTREYIDRDGIKRYYTEIHVQHFTFLTPKSSSQGASRPSHVSEENNGNGASYYNRTEQPDFDDTSATGAETDTPSGDDDLPF